MCTDVDFRSQDDDLVYRRSMPRLSATLLCLASMLLACGDGEATSDSGTGFAGSGGWTDSSTTGMSSTGATKGSGTNVSDGQTDSESSSSSDPTTGGTDDTATTIKFDVGDSGDTSVDTDDDPPGPTCHVVDDMDAIGDCEQSAPPDSFAPDVQWTFGEGERSMVTPLAGNFTDDNQDGEINLCDIPDILLVSGTTIGYGQTCPIHVIDGATGVQHFQIEGVSCFGTPAFGDIDNDGLPEIVAVYNDNSTYRLRAFEHDGTPKWTNTTDGGSAQQFQRESGAVAIHDLDADGHPEIVFNHEVYDQNGVMLWEHINPNPGELEASTAVDLDGDGLMEVVTGHSAYHHDGSVFFDNYPTIPGQSIPQIANLDDDPDPEIFVTSGAGLFMVEHDGQIKWGPTTPTGVAAGGYLVWQRPGTVHDFDGDGQPEYASSSRDYYAVYKGHPASVLWQSVVKDSSGAAGGTAFDFIGNGIAEAMYADEQNFRIYDGKTGEVLLTQPRSSNTISEYPTVVDVDNDGSAEILVVSISGQPALQVLRDAEDRWIQARRIWNQHAYYVTNVREDSTIPQFPVNPWEYTNTFRTNAQIEGGAVCVPQPPG